MKGGENKVDYDNMDILDIARELRNLLDKFNKGERINETEFRQMRILSSNFSKECSDILYDWGK